MYRKANRKSQKLSCNNGNDNWVSEVSNRRTEVNSDIFTMNLALISLHRRGVFRQPWFALTSFTSDFGNSPFRFTSSRLLPFDSESSQNSPCFGGNPLFLEILVIIRLRRHFFLFTHCWIRTFALFKQKKKKKKKKNTHKKLQDQT